MDDILKLAQQFGGTVVPEPAPADDITALAAQFGGTIAQTPGGYGAGTFATDIAKNVAAGAVPGVLGTPEALQSSAIKQSKSVFAAPSEVLSYLSSPDKLANKFVESLGFKPIFGEETKGLVPEETLKKQEMVLDEVTAKGKSKWLKDLSTYGSKLGQDIAETVSPEMKLAMANFVPTGSLSDIAHGRLDKLSLGANPTLLGFAGQFSNVFGSVAPGMLGTIVTKDPRYMQVFGFGQGGSEAIGNARQYIGSLNDEQLAKNSPYFKELLGAGYDPKTARLMVEEKAAETAATAEGVVGTLGGSFTANLITGKFDKALLSSVKNRALRIAAQAGKGGVTGATEEGLQEMSEGIASDLGIDKTVAKEIGSDAFANLILGAIGGGGPGAVSGARAKPEQAPVPPTTPAAPTAAAPTAPTPPAAPAQAVAAGLVSPEELETAAPEVTTPKVEAAKETKPTFDEWRTEQGLTFRSKEAYEAALPELKKAYEAEISGKAAEPIPAKVEAPVEIEEPKKVQAEEKPAKEVKALRGVDAPNVPLHEFHLGIIAAMMDQAANPAIVSDDAIKLLKANDLVKEAADGTLSLLPKGNALLNDIRKFNDVLGKEKSADEQKALFSKFIPQIEEEPGKKVEVKPEEPEVKAEPEKVEEPAAVEEEPAKKELEPVKTQAEINKERQKSKRAQVEENAKDLLRERLNSDTLINVVSSKDGKSFFASGSNQRDPSYFVKLDLLPSELRQAQELDKRANEAKGFTNVSNATNKLRKFLTDAAKRAVEEKKLEEVEKPKAEKKVKAEPIEGTVRITSPTEADLINKFSKYLGGSSIRVDGQDVYNAKGLMPDYKVRKKGGRYQLVELAKQAETKPSTKTQAEINKERQAEKKAKVEEKKPSTAIVPKMDEEWADYKKALVEKPSYEEPEVFDKYKTFQAGDFALNKVSFTGAEAIKRANAANKEIEKTYQKAARLFLSHEINAPFPKKNQPKLVVEDGMFALPPPIAKKITAKASTLEDQKKALMTVAAPKDELRKMLQGVLVQPNRLVVTDGHRLAMYDTKTNVEKDQILDKDGKVMDTTYPDYMRIVDKAKGATKAGMVNATALGNYARGTRKAYRYISADPKSSLFTMQIGKNIVAFNGRYIEDMANMFRQFGYEGFEASFDDRGGGGGMLVATSPDGKLTQYVMSMRNEGNVFQPFNISTGKPGAVKVPSNIIDIEAREITPEQKKLISNTTKEWLNAKEIGILEKHYGEEEGSDGFIKRLREDVITYTNKGAEAVDKVIRSIITKMQAGLLSVAMIFNPMYMSQQTVVVYPSKVTTEQVRAAVPEQAKEMSDSGKKAFSTLFAALQPELQANDKLFTVVDKPTSKVFVFNPDGSLLTKDNVVLGMALGDTYVGQTDFKGNRITPAGLFNVTAEKGGPTYDGKTIYTVGNTKEGWNTAFMHTVYLKEADAAARKKGLATGEGTRLSHGCVNAAPEVMAKIGEGNRMDKSHVFVVPDNQAKVDDYIANTVPNEDLTRETVAPATKTTKTPEIKVERKQVAREEEAAEPRKTQAEINRERQAEKKRKAQAVQEMVQPNVQVGKKQTSKERVQEIHEEQISEYAKLRKRLGHLTRKVAEGKINIGMQREINDLLELTRELKQDIKLTTPKNNTAEHFYKRALEEYTKGNITRDVLDVVKYFYDNNPEILNGIKLSVRQTDQEGHMGNFGPIQRLVTLYKKAGANSPETARHEIMHSLEQMMNSDTRQAIVDSWKDALEMAIKQYSGDMRSSMYFNAVLDFIANPTEGNFKRAVSIMPSKDLYQFINPSEFWAVNAEKLMKAKMGTPWAKFVKFMKMLGEGLKSLFGLENQYAVHKAFNELLSGNGKRMDKQSLTSYMHAGDLDFDFLNDVKDTDDLLDKHNRSDAPIHTSSSVTDQLLGGVQAAKKIVTRFKESPKGAAINMVGNVDRAILSARIDTTDFTAGLTAADAAKYGRDLVDSMGRAIASVAMNQALKATRIGTQVIMRGKLAFDPVNQMFHAVQDKFSMANILTLKHDLEREIGKQRAANVIQAYFEAKRSKSIVQEYLDREAELDRLLAEQEDPSTSAQRQTELIKDIEEASKDLGNIKVALDKVNMDDEAIEDFIKLDKEYPQLKEMMENWNSVNHNMIDMMEHARIISDKRAATLRAIKDYVPWQRIQDEQTDVHAPIYGSKGVRNINREHRFKEGRVEADIDDIVDNMLHNVMVTTRNSIKNYAANRIAQEYAERNEKGKIRVYPKEDFEHGIVKILVNGRKINVKISDPLVAKSVIGIEHIQIPMNEIMAYFANGLRRSITFSGIFQVKQLFMDAPTAALVTGVKNPAKLFAGVFGSFVKGLTQNDPVIELLKSYGIGGYHSGARTAEHQYKQEIGLINKSYMAKATSILDQIADASDFAQRRAVYNRVMAESNGDQRKAILAATNVIDFDKRGAGRTAQFLNRTIAFMNAYAQQIDVLAQALAEPIAGGVEALTGQKLTSISGNLKGITRAQAISRLAVAGGLLASTCLLYSMAVGDDDEYKKMDDQTKMRNFVIPKSLMKQIGYEHSLLIPMHTSASYFFKSIPELLYNKITKEGTKDAIDNTRLRKALAEGAVDALLGPLGSGPIPTAFKPGVEILLNRNFFTGGPITPEGMKNLDPSRQYRGSTSELGKWFSTASGLGTNHRLLNPIEADHIMRSLGGSVAAIAMWGSNLFSGNKATPTERDNILYGSFVAPDVGRGREDLFYDLQQRANTAMGTFKDLQKKGYEADASKWFKDHEGAIQAYGFTEAAGRGLQEINAQIRRLEDLPANKMSPAEKRKEIDYFKKKKEDILEQTIAFRFKAGL